RDGLDDRKQVLGAVQDFAHQHLLPLLGLPAGRDVFPGDDEAADPTLVVPPRPDITFQPEGGAIRPDQLVTGRRLAGTVKTATVGISPSGRNLGKDVVMVLPDDAVPQ